MCKCEVVDIMFLRKCNSLLVKIGCVENVMGFKSSAEASGHACFDMHGGRGAFQQ